MIYNTSKRFLPILNSDQPGPPGPGPGPDYSTMPVTFEAISGDTYLVCERNTKTSAIDNTFYYKRNNSNWQQYTFGDQITLNMGDKVSFSGTTYNFGIQGQSCPFNFYGGNKMKVYGNIHSLVNYYPLNSTQNIFRNLFRGNGDGNNYGNMATGIEDCSDLWLPVPEDFGGTYSVVGIYGSAFRANNDIKYFPRVRMTNWSLYSSSTLDAAGYNSPNICYVEVDYETYNTTALNYFLYGVNSYSASVFIKPKNLPLTRGNRYIPNGWTVINKDNGKTYIANSDNSNGAEVIVSKHGEITYV